MYTGNVLNGITQFGFKTRLFELNFIDFTEDLSKTIVKMVTRRRVHVVLFVMGLMILNTCQGKKAMKNK